MTDRREFIVALAGCLLAVSLFWSGIAVALTAPNTVESRGELLYSTHCTGCHTTQIHWRDKRLATDWGTLKEQVLRWSSNTGQAWDEDDVLKVTQHLNELYYHFPMGNGQIGGSPRGQDPIALNSFRIPTVFAKH